MQAGTPSARRARRSSEDAYRAEVHDLRRTWTQRVRTLSAPLETRGQPRRMPRRLARTRRRSALRGGDVAAPVSWPAERAFYDGWPRTARVVDDDGRARMRPRTRRNVVGGSRRARTLRQCHVVTAGGIGNRWARTDARIHPFGYKRGRQAIGD